MRNLHDKTGLTIFPEEIHGRDAYASMLEGSPFMARKMRLMQGRELMQSPAHYVHGLDELERELIGMPRDFEQWAPGERWTARLVSEPDWPQARRSYLRVTWYQEGGDPMLRLAEIVSLLDFRSLCAVEPYGDDD